MQERLRRSSLSPSTVSVPEYEAFYGFQDPPFRLVPDPDYLFLSPKHRQALGYLIDGVREGSGVSVLTGKVGTGKTTLARAVVRDLEPEATAAYIFYPPSTPMELLETINAELGLPYLSMSERELVDSLNRYLLEQSEAGRRVFVVIDEAQRLEPVVLEHLRLLSNLETQKEKLLPIILVGQPELKDLLARPELVQLNQRVTSRWHLEPLNKAESAAYIRHRLEVAGGAKATYLFPTQALHEAYRFARGVPRVLNIVCHRALALGYAKEEHSLTLATVRQAFRELKLEAQRNRWLWVFPALDVTRVSEGLLLGTAAVGLGLVIGIGAMRYFSPPAATLPVTGASEGTTAGQTPSPRLSEGAGTSAPPVSDRESRDLTAVLETSALGDKALPAQSPTAGDVSARETFLRDLSRLDPAQSMVQAVERLLQVLGREGLSEQEKQGGKLDLKRIAAARRLAYLPFRGNFTLLTLLDRPVILELLSSERGNLQFVPLLRIGESTGQVFLGQERAAPLAVIEEQWRGKAHLLWNNFDNVKTFLSVGSVGPGVKRLHRLLTQAQRYRGPLSEVFTEKTREAVVLFQQANGLEPDGIAGPMTFISLYNSGYHRSSLRAGRVLSQSDEGFWRKGEGVYFKVGELLAPEKGEP
jgi:general secretion pathway protein A